MHCPTISKIVEGAKRNLYLSNRFTDDQLTEFANGAITAHGHRAAPIRNLSIASYMQSIMFDKLGLVSDYDLKQRALRHA